MDVAKQIETDIAKKGRAYLCLGCLKFVHERRYVEAHYYKYHVHE